MDRACQCVFMESCKLIFRQHSTVVFIVVSRQLLSKESPALVTGLLYFNNTSISVRLKVSVNLADGTQFKIRGLRLGFSMSQHWQKYCFYFRLRHSLPLFAPKLPACVKTIRLFLTFAAQRGIFCARKLNHAAEFKERGQGQPGN